jgi:hypothetical protein
LAPAGSWTIWQFSTGRSASSLEGVRCTLSAARFTAWLVLLSTMALTLMLAGSAASATISFPPGSPGAELASVEAAMIEQRDALPPGTARGHLTRALQSMNWATADVHWTPDGFLAYSEGGQDGLRDLRTTIGRLTWVGEPQTFKRHVIAIAAALGQIAHRRTDLVGQWLASADSAHIATDVRIDFEYRVWAAQTDLRLGDRTADRVHAAAAYTRAWLRVYGLTPGWNLDAISRPLLGNAYGAVAADSNPAGLAEAFRYGAFGTGAVSKIRLYLGPEAAPKALVAGLYADEGGHPGALLAQGRLDGPTADAYNVVQLRWTAPVVASTFAAMSYYWIALLAPDGAGTIHFRDGGCCGRAQAEVYVTQGLTELPAAWDTGVASTDYAASAQALE